MSERRLTDAELEASRWIARLEASDVSLEDHNAFRAWLDASPKNRAAHEAVSRSWDRLDALKLLGQDSTAYSSVRLPSRRHLLFAGGAGAVLSAAGAVWLATPATTFAATYETSVGERERAMLQDGSEIELNAVTSIEAAFTARAREVRLERGEALFTVITDERPFRVVTPRGDITALAGTYLVKAFTDAVRLTVISGEASVRGRRAPLRAGNEITIGNQARDVEALAPEAAARRLAWRDHMLAFDGEMLGEAAAEVGRQTGVHFEFADPALAQLPVGGYLRGDDVEGFIGLVNANLSVKATRQGDTILLEAAP